MRRVEWSLIAGGKPGQEVREEKLKEGYAYIERLKEDETVLEVVEEENKIIITIDG